ncbi:hypothetical protein Bca52824_000215 [Brassica carinata]|uniref:Uncharacterized protein n=1 Tax=Brassica carinata TaxID=52824 RepID=A0A8X8BBG3_BRACI|nr:hypothetical protein Bca52824_000215 [Brassica carinata]
MEENDVYTEDGTVDIHKNPANKKTTGSWKACRFILGNVCCERLAYYGMTTNLVNYLESRLNQGKATATNNVTIWSATCYITPLIGAFLADAYLGRYWTIATFVFIYVSGMTLLTLSASVPGLKPGNCNGDTCHPSSSQTAVFFVAFYMVALGTGGGGMEPCVSSFGADQYDENDVAEKLKRSSFFNWFYFSNYFGAFFATLIIFWIQISVGWAWGFGVPTVAMVIAVMFFFSGSCYYRLQRPGGSPLTRLFQVIVAAFRKMSVEVPEDKSLLFETADDESNITGSRKLEHTDNLKFLDKAAVESESDSIQDGEVNPWRLCSVTQVEEVKSIITLLPFWASGIVFATVYSQMNTMFVLQGNTMDQHMGKHFEIPSDSLSLVSLLFLTPVYDQFIIPFARMFTRQERGFTQLQRMGIGQVISIFAMITAGVLEVVRLDYVKTHNAYDEKKSPSVFTFIGQLEFFYDQAPDATRSLCSALSLTTIELGNYLSTVLVTVVMKMTKKKGKPGWIPDNLNRGHLDYYFYLLAALSFLNFLVYLLISKRYKYKKAIGRAH